MTLYNENLVKTLVNNGVVVMPTDTLYGVVGLALSKETVERIYDTRRRAPNKPCIILIGKIGELEKFSIKLSDEQKNKLGEFWPGPVSIVLDCKEERFSYLHRGTNTLAFRLPSNSDLQNLLKTTGPLVAPSANIEGMPVANNTKEAKDYFGDKVDLYIDGGEIIGKSSKVIKLNTDGSEIILRV
jgi:L-threonylcarbamoyladenylate synthase